MKKIILSVLMLASVSVWAGLTVQNGTSQVGTFSKLKCSSGLTCSKEKDYVLMTSTPVAGSIVATNTNDAVLTLSADNSDDNGDDWVIKALASGNSLVFYNDTSGSNVAKLSLSTTGAMLGAGTGSLSGFLQKQIASTTTSLSAAQCGSTIVNDSADVLTLPEASTVLGCRYTFVVANASN